MANVMANMMKSRYRKGNVIKTIAMKLFFFRKGKEKLHYGVWKKTGVQMPGSVPINYTTVLLMSIIS